MTVESALSRERSERVLSIQSHVVHGYAGNKCSVLPLQLHGFEVDFINSVQFSNHAGFVFAHLDSPPRSYKHVKGQKLTDADLNELYEGLKLNNINNYSHILTGYCGNVDFLRKIADIVADLKSRHEQTLFVCDPVMGDNGRYYVPENLLPIYRDVIVPLADVLTPNAFELGELTGTKVNTIEDAVQGMDAMHERGVRVVVVTSGIEAAQSEQSLICLASIYDRETKEKKRFKFEFPRLVGQFVGTGDTFTSLLVVWLTELRGDVKEAVRRVLCSMQGVLKKTSSYAQKQMNSDSKAMSELRLVQSRIELLAPPTIDNIRIEEL